MNAIDRASSILGTQALLARRLGVTKAAVGQWKLPGRKVPAKHCPAVERLTDGKVTCEDLRPDIDWSYLRQHRCNHTRKSFHKEIPKSKRTA